MWCADYHSLKLALFSTKIDGQLKCGLEEYTKFARSEKKDPIFAFLVGCIIEGEEKTPLRTLKIE